MQGILNPWAGNPQSIANGKRWLFGKDGKNVDDMDNGAPGHAGDPGYDSIMETTGISWWNVNPIYAAWFENWWSADHLFPRNRILGPFPLK